MLNEALAYATHGWPVFPLRGKVPYTKHGLKDATTDDKQIYEWWHRWPDANIGYAIHPGLVILDIDPRHGGQDSLQELLGRHGPLTPTLICLSGRGDGGHHLYFIHPGGRLTDKRLGEGIDIRVGGKHYVVAPPSRHPDTGQPYRWFREEQEIATPPQWLAELLRVPIEAPRPPAPRTGKSNGSGLIDFVASAQEGNRNHAYFWACCTALSDGIYPSIREDMKAAARSIGLTDHEIEATAASAERRQR